MILPKSVYSSEELDFTKSFTKALKSAKKEDKFIFAYIYTDWSVPSQRMMESTFVDSSVVHELTSDYINLKINVARNTSFAKEFEIHVYPTIMVIDKWGNALVRDTGYKTPKQLLRTIHKTRSKSRYLLESIDSLLIGLNADNILQTIDSVKYYRDEFTAKNLAKKYLDRNKGNWGEKASMILLNEYLTLDKKYLKFVSRNNKVFFANFDSLRLKENIAFQVFLNSLKKDVRGRPVFEFKPLKRWFRKYKIKDLDKMEDFIKIKYRLWGRGPSVRSSIELINNYPETPSQNVLYSSVIKILLTNPRRNMDYDELVESLEDSLVEGEYWRYDVLSLLYFKMGDDKKANEAIQTARDISEIMGIEYEPTLNFIKDKIDR